MVIQMNIKNELGDFYSEEMVVTKTEYVEMTELSKKFYVSETGFEMWTKDGFMIVPPELTRRSILSINIIEYEDDGQV